VISEKKFYVGLPTFHECPDILMISDFAGDRQLRQLCCYSLQAVPDDRIKVVAVRHVVVHTVGIDHVTMPYTTVRVQHLQQTISCHITRLRTAPLHVCTRPNNSFSLHNNRTMRPTYGCPEKF